MLTWEGQNTESRLPRLSIHLCGKPKSQLLAIPHGQSRARRAHLSALPYAYMGRPKHGEQTSQTFYNLCGKPKSQQITNNIHFTGCKHVGWYGWRIWSHSVLTMTLVWSEYKAVELNYNQKLTKLSPPQSPTIPHLPGTSWWTQQGHKATRSCWDPV